MMWALLVTLLTPLWFRVSFRNPPARQVPSSTGSDPIVAGVPRTASTETLQAHSDEPLTIAM